MRTNTVAVNFTNTHIIGIAKNKATFLLLLSTQRWTVMQNFLYLAFHISILQCVCIHDGFAQTFISTALYIALFSQCTSINGATCDYKFAGTAHIM